MLLDAFEPNLSAVVFLFLENLIKLFQEGLLFTLKTEVLFPFVLVVYINLLVAVSSAEDHYRWTVLLKLD